MDIYRIKFTVTEPLLGTVPKSKEIYAKWVQSRAELTEEQKAEELATVEELEEHGWTGFHMLEGQPLIYDYVFKGFLKEACGMLRRVSGTRSSKLQAYKKVIDGLVFPFPRRVMLDLNGGELGVMERPLRAQTAQGERVALVRSDTCPEGTSMEITLKVLGVVKEPLLREWLDYGELRGLGQWRNASWGRFVFELEKLEA